MIQRLPSYCQDKELEKKTLSFSKRTTSKIAIIYQKKPHLNRTFTENILVIIYILGILNPVDLKREIQVHHDARH